MIQNIFKVAYRTLKRHKGFTVINIAGLTLGITACILIALFVWDEKQFDKFIPEGNQVYRVASIHTDHEEVLKTPRTPPMFAVSLQQQYPEVEKSLRVLDLQGKSLFEAGNTKIYEENGLAVDNTFFDVFPIHFLYGSADKVLDDPSTIILTEQLSKKYFGDENPLGKQILIDKEPYLVRGVLDDQFDKFHLQLTYLMTMPRAMKILSIPNDRMQSWGWQQFYTYIKLRKGSDIDGLQNKFQSYIYQNVTPALKAGGSSYVPFFQPLFKIHLYSSDFKIDNSVRGNISYVNGLTIIAIFILLIACFNFINLSTAKSLQRAKEVGIRKSIGAAKYQLLLQYMGETILLAIISLIISIVISAICLQTLNHFTNKNIELSIFIQPQFLLFVIFIIIIVGVIAGIYPSIVLSSFQPVKVLKGATTNAIGKVPWLRHTLVIVQFSLSVLLIISAIIVYRQVDFLHNKSLGFNKDQILFFPMRGDNMNKNYESFKNQLLQSSDVSSVSIGYGFPGDIFANDDIIVPSNGENKTYSATQLLVDEDYVKTLGLQIVAGRDFSKDIPTDKDEGFIINETAVKQLGLGTPEKAIGQPLMWKVWESKMPDSMKKGRIVGVVKDFHYKSLYDKLTTAVIQIYPPAYWKVAVKLKSANFQQAIGYVKNVWNRFSPDYPIEYKFLDESFGEMYQAEDKLRTLLFIFTGVAIFVGCMGLFGLAAYAAERRTKEIGIRKVLGASVHGLIVLLSKDFLKLVLISLIIAWPIAWYFMNKWLQDFAYRINISLWIFVVGGIIALLIAMLTVAYQGLKAAIANPLKNLRTE